MSMPAIFIRLCETGLTSAKAACVPGRGDSKGDRVECSWRAWAHVKVLLPAILSDYVLQRTLSLQRSEVQEKEHEQLDNRR